MRHGVAAGAGSGVEEGAAQLGDEAGQGQRARDVGEGARLGAGVDDVEVGRGLLVLAAHGGDDEAPPGPGARDVEQAGLVVAHLGPGGPGLGRAAGDDVDEVGGAEEGAAQPQVGPDALLDARDDDEVPLEAGGGRGGRARATDSPVAARADEGVAGDVLAEHVVEEVGRARRREPVDEAGGGVEQPEHGVEVAVGAAAGRAAAEGGVAPRRTRPLALHIAHSTSSTPSPSRRASTAGREDAVDPAGGRGLGADPVEGEGREHGLGEQDVARPAPAVVELDPRRDRRSRRRPHGVGTADR